MKRFLSCSLGFFSSNLLWILKLEPYFMPAHLKTKLESLLLPSSPSNCYCNFFFTSTNPFFSYNKIKCCFQDTSIRYQTLTSIKSWLSIFFLTCLLNLTNQVAHPLLQRFITNLSSSPNTTFPKFTPFLLSVLPISTSVGTPFCRFSFSVQQPLCDKIHRKDLWLITCLSMQ